MAICPNCGYANDVQAKFCMKCGTRLDMPAPSQEQINYGNSMPYPAEPIHPVGMECAPAQPAENPGIPMDDTFTMTTPVELVERSSIAPEDGAHPKKKKKKIIIFSIAGTLVLLLVVAGIFIGPYISHYFEGNSAMDRGNYEEAIASYTKANGFFGADEKLEKAHYEYGKVLLTEGKFYEAATQFAEATSYDDHQEKMFECGNGLIKGGNYKQAVEVFDAIGSGTDVSEAKSYAEGMELFDSFNYSDARDKFVSAGSYSDAEDMANACCLMQAEACASAGSMDRALTFYKEVPNNFSYNGISASERIALIENNSSIIALAGQWKPTSSHTRSSNGRMYWYQEKILTTVYMNILCKLDTDGKLVLSGTVYYPLLPEYDSVSESSAATIKSETFSLKDLTGVPSTITLSDNASLTYTNGDYKFYYSDSNSSGHTRMVNVTYSQSAN